MKPEIGLHLTCDKDSNTTVTYTQVAESKIESTDKNDSFNI